MSSVRLSETLDRWWIVITGWKSWKLIAQTISPTPSLLAAKLRRSTYSQGNMEEFWAGTRGGVRKNGVLNNKGGNISETRKDGGKVTMEGL